MPKQQTLRPIITLDGEGITYAEAEPQHYRLFVNFDSATGRAVLYTGVFPSRRIFEYLLSLPNTHLKVGFGLNYDVNQWLVSLPLEALQTLWREGSARWQEYRIHWTPGRVFRLEHVDGRRVTVWDCFSYFQCSFIDAIKRWNVGTELEREMIESMKEQRGQFTDADIPMMAQYCELECRLLADLFCRLRDDMHAAGFRPSRYDGAGSLASYLLNKHEVKRAIKAEPSGIRTAVLGAYYGGRIEVSRVGDVGDVFTYDIHSAYPAAIRRLPCLCRAHWRPVLPAAARQLTLAGAQTLAFTSWDIGPHKTNWPPLPWRKMGKLSRGDIRKWAAGDEPSRIFTNSGITFPENGSGWHWGVELKAALECYPNMEMEFGQTWQLVTGCDHQPFAFIDAMYARRRELEAAGREGMAHVIKVALAAISGKLSQSETEGKRAPAFQSFVLAGLATALCRAWVLRAIASDPDSIVSVATDGIASVSRLPVQTGDGMGEWGEGRLRDLFIVAPGIYSAVLADGSEYSRTRGFYWREFSFPAVRREWRIQPTHTYRWYSYRFHGLGLALAGGMDRWRSWVRTPRSINAFPNARFPRVEGVPPERSPQTPVLIECVPQRFRVPLGASLPESWPYEPRNADRWVREVENETAAELLAYLDDGRL